MAGARLRFCINQLRIDALSSRDSLLRALVILAHLYEFMGDLVSCRLISSPRMHTCSSLITSKLAHRPILPGNQKSFLADRVDEVLGIAIGVLEPPSDLVRSALFLPAVMHVHVRARQEVRSSWYEQTRLTLLQSSKGQPTVSRR